MRRSRIISAVVAVAATAAAVIAIAPSASAATGKYVALGDSYAVAVGTRTYDDPNDACRRGPTSYTRLWAAAHPDYSFVEASCSGTKTADVLANEVPQMTADTTLATVQVGGNDVGFVAVLENCILTLDDQACIDGANTASQAAQAYLPTALTGLYQSMKAQSPSARIIVVGYPRLYTIHGDCGILGLSDAERTALNNAADVLSNVTSAAAAAAGVEYLDARPVFDPHSICSGGGEWVTSLEWSKLDESYHPNTEGHRDGYFAALNAMTG
jgi:lysophospholipase L1-like esterase